MRICFYRFLHVILHEGRSCPELQNPLYQKAKENLLPGDLCPSGRLRGGGKCSLPALTHHLLSYHLSRSARVILWMMDSATSPSAPRRMTALVEISENQMKTKGGFSPFLEDQTLITWRNLSVHLSHTRGLGNIIAHFLSSFLLLRRVTGVAHERNFNSLNFHSVTDT